MSCFVIFCEGEFIPFKHLGLHHTDPDVMRNVVSEINLFLRVTGQTKKFPRDATRYRLRVASDREIEAKKSSDNRICVRDLNGHQRHQLAATYHEQLQMLLHPTFIFLNGLY